MAKQPVQQTQSVPIIKERPQAQLQDWLAMAALILIWGTAFAFIKIAVTDLSPGIIVFSRLALAGLVLLAYALLSGARLPPLNNFKHPAWLGIFLVAFFGNSLPYFLIAWGQKWVDSGLSAVLIGSMPLWTLILTHFVTADEKLHLRGIVGVIFGIAGIMVLFGPTVLTNLGGANFPAQLAIFFAGFCYAVSTIAARKYSHDDPIGGAATMNCLAALLALPVAIFVAPDWTATNANAWLAVLALAVGSTGIASILYLRTAARAGANFIAMGNNLTPVCAVITGILLLGERLHWSAFVAAVLIIAGVAIAQSRPSRRQVTASRA